jgi:hypothetical protein
MADAIRYIHPNEVVQYTVDFQDVLPSTDSALSNIAGGSTITAVASDGSDADSILSAKTRTSKTLLVTFQLCTDGEEYVVSFLGEGATSKQRFIKTLKLLCRKQLAGEF